MLTISGKFSVIAQADLTRNTPNRVLCDGVQVTVWPRDVKAFSGHVEDGELKQAPVFASVNTIPAQAADPESGSPGRPARTVIQLTYQGGGRELVGTEGAALVSE